MRLPRTSGVLLHPSSLPGPHGSGDCGPAAYHFVDWLVSAGQSLWQILPLNPPGAGNSPYSSDSAFAGNPLLVDLQELQQQGWLQEAEIEPVPSLLAERVDYAVVRPYRMERLAWASQRFAALPETDPRQQAFAEFCAAHTDWLDDYALFMTLNEAHEHRSWTLWPDALRRRDVAALSAAAAMHGSRIAFWKFCQWSFFRQWLQLRAYANGRGIDIIGDVPIFIGHHSSEVWSHQQLFDLDDVGMPTVVAGVPPDFFSTTGQRWGNPLYRWERHARDGYAWWVQRMRRVFELVDIVRIDHFRGFAGYWEIPADEPTAVRGRWRPGPGAELFEAMESALGPLPIIAEDLGVITPDVEALRLRLSYPGMCVLQFAFGGDPSNGYLPHHHRHDAVVYPGTHDNDTSSGWWDSASAHERAFAQAYLGNGTTDMAWTLIRCACASVADTAIYAMQDLLSLPSQCRMNHPGRSDGWWEWRMQWSQVEPVHAARLLEYCRLYDRPRRRVWQPG